MFNLDPIDKNAGPWAAELIKRLHYLHAMPHHFSRPYGYRVTLAMDDSWAGLLIFNRTQVVYQRGFFGQLSHVAADQAPYTNWQILNLCRVLVNPDCQPGGSLYTATHLPGYYDRKGEFKSTLASEMIRASVSRIGFDYLMAKPPVFLDQPYEITYLVSYCNTSLHRGVIYRAAGFELYTNAPIQMYRHPIPALTPSQHTAIMAASMTDGRANRLRERRMQLQLF
jgi:hypothetical protein